jgi:predicted nucleotidyltransferase
VERNSVATIIRVLNQAKVRYLVVGGLAVVAHGYVRFTADFDLILDLETDNVSRALGALASLGYRPLVPVPLLHFADPAIRAQWIREKGLTVFTLFSPEHEATEIDLFVQDPFPFDKAYARAARLEVAPGLLATFVSFDDLVFLKQQAGRPKDLEDIQRLNAARQRSSNE